MSLKGEILNNTAYFMTINDIDTLEYLIKVLNSSLIDWYYRTLSVQLGEKAVRMFSLYVLKLPIPNFINSELQKQIVATDHNNPKLELLIRKLYDV